MAPSHSSASCPYIPLQKLLWSILCLSSLSTSANIVPALDPEPWPDPPAELVIVDPVVVVPVHLCQDGVNSAVINAMHPTQRLRVVQTKRSWRSVDVMASMIWRSISLMAKVLQGLHQSSQSLTTSSILQTPSCKTRPPPPPPPRAPILCPMTELMQHSHARHPLMQALNTHMSQHIFCKKAAVLCIKVLEGRQQVLAPLQLAQIAGGCIRTK